MNISKSGPGILLRHAGKGAAAWIDHLDGRLFVDRLQKRDRRKVQQDLDDLAEGRFQRPYPVVPPAVHAGQA